MFSPDAGRDVSLRAHYVVVNGGRIIMGNATDPIDNSTRATISLHGDKYMATVKKNGVWTKIHNFKRMDHDGNLTMNGRATTTISPLGANAKAGSYKLTLAVPAPDWGRRRAPGPWVRRRRPVARRSRRLRPRRVTAAGRWGTARRRFRVLRRSKVAASR